MNDKIKKNDIVYYARIMPKLDVYDVYELKVRTVEDTYEVMDEILVETRSDLSLRELTGIMT